MVSKSRFPGSFALLSLLLVAWVTGPARAEEDRPLAGYPVVHVIVETPEQVVQVQRMAKSVLSEHIGVGALDLIIAPEKLEELDQLGLRYKVLVDDIQVFLDRERVWRDSPGRGWFDAYKTYTEINDYIDQDLIAAYPNLISKEQIGTSVEGRAIHALTITSPTGGPDKPAICFNALQHAREWITPMTVMYITDRFVRGYESDPQIQTLLDELVFYIIPVVNPDGYEYTWLGDDERWWRKNRRDNGDGTFGVDLNRNWGYEWGGAGTSSDPGDNLYHGPYAFSEPETQAVSNFILAHPEILSHIDFHSYSQLILWPFGYDYVDPPEPDNWILTALGFGMSDAIYNVHGETYVAEPSYALYPAAGTCADWVYGSGGAYSYVFELRPVGAPYFILPPEEIIPTAEENYAAALVMAEYFLKAVDIYFPNGLPATISAGSDTTIDIVINGVREAVVPGSQRMRYRYDPAGPFVEVPLTLTGINTYEVVLPATNCISTPEFYFTVNGDGGTTVTSPDSAPPASVHTASIVTPGLISFYSEDLSTNPGWTVEGDWAWGQPTGSGGEYGEPDPTSGHTGPNVYGYNLSGDYPNSLSEQHLTSAPIDCTGRHGVNVSFWRWLGVEEPAYDHAFVRVSNNGTDWVTVWSNGVTIEDSSWTLHTYNISAVADNQPTVYLRWTMGSTDGGWRFCGWNIDDIELSVAVCDGILGDYNGDGEVDGIDFDEFGPCYNGTGNPFGPGCGIFDFDDDDDVDCTDWAGFEEAWAGGGEPPTFDPCEAFTVPTADAAEKNRFISFTPGSSMGEPQAFRVTTVSNPVFPQSEGWGKWVGAPDGYGISRLLCEPVYRVWDSATVHVGDQDIVPGATYAIEATLDGIDFLSPVAIATVSVWGDTVGVFEDGAWGPPNGSVDITSDAVALVDGFKHLPTAPPATWCETFPDRPHASIDIMDIVLVIDAFKGMPYPHDPPVPCP